MNTVTYELKEIRQLVDRGTLSPAERSNGAVNKWLQLHYCSDYTDSCGSRRKSAPTPEG